MHHSMSNFTVLLLTFGLEGKEKETNASIGEAAYLVYKTNPSDDDFLFFYRYSETIRGNNPALQFPLL